MSTKSKKGRKFSHEADYSKAVMDMKYPPFSPQTMPGMNHLMPSNQHLSNYGSPYASAGFASSFGQGHNMSYSAWNHGVGGAAGFGLPTSMVSVSYLIVVNYSLRERERERERGRERGGEGRGGEGRGRGRGRERKGGGREGEGGERQRETGRKEGEGDRLLGKSAGGEMGEETGEGESMCLEGLCCL